MPPQVAIVVFGLGILGLFVLDRDPKARTSKALWIPVLYLLIAGSRPVSQWLALAGFGNGSPIIDSPDQYLDGSPLDRLFLSGLLAAGIIVLLRRGEQVRRLLRHNAPIILFFFYCLASTLWSDYPTVAFKRWTKALGDVVMVLIVLTDADPLSAVKRLLTRLGFLLVPLSVLFVKYYPDLGRAYSRWEGARFYTGIAMDKNMLGMICLVLALGAEWRLTGEFQGRNKSNKMGPRIAQMTLFAMALWLLWIANSVTSLSCFLMASGLIVVTRRPSLARNRALIHLLVVVLVVVALSALFLDAGAGLVKSMGRDPTLTGRTGLWKQLISMSPNALLGAGYESFWLGKRLEQLWSAFRWRPNEAHNGYLEVFLNLGWIGLGLLAIVIVTGYRNVVQVLRRDREIGRLKLAYFIVGVTYSFTEAGFRMMSPIWVFFLLATIAVPEDPLVKGWIPTVAASCDTDIDETPSATTEELHI